MGKVYLAEQLEVGRRVVVKLLHDPRQVLTDSSGEERFKREAQALAQLNHPNIVQLYAFGRAEDGTPYLAMEYIAGRTLAAEVEERGALPEPEVCAILDQLCGALVEAHRCGVVHRDLKPENVMLSATRAGRIKVLDFGIAKLRHASQVRLTHSRELLGTPLYMAPEQLQGQAADERTDIWALGLIGYELLTGDVPFEADTALSLMMKVVNDAIIPPRQRAPEREVTEALDSLISRCLEKDPNQRFQSAEELQKALATVYTAPPLSASGAGHYPSEWTRRQPSAAEPMTLSLEVTETPRRRSSAGRAAWATLLTILVLGGGAALYATDQLPWLTLQPPPGSVAQTEWIQGIPFPAGSTYPSFEDEFIEAHVAVDPERVITFYQALLKNRWPGYSALPQGLVFEDEQAPIHQVTVTPLDDGSRIVITRRARTD